MWAGTSTNPSKLITNLKQNANVLFDVMTRNSQVTIRASVVELLITYFSIKVSRMKIIRGK
jgi:ATP-dependent Clp protease adapter protein ClpS